MTGQAGPTAWESPNHPSADPASACRWAALRKGAAIIRARRYPIAGAYGTLHIGPKLKAVDAVSVPLDDPHICWLRAHSLVRELNDCTLIPPTDLTD